MMGKKLLLILILLSSFKAYSASFNIMPIKVYLSQTDKIETITLTNQNTQPLTVHFQLKKWTQENGKDHYEETKDILVLPHICTLEPQSSQVIRLALKTSPDARLEKAYRLYATEIPHQDQSISQKGLMLSLRMGIPVFIHPLQDSKAPVSSVKISSKNKKLLFQNITSKHIHIGSVRGLNDSKEPHKIYQYILPNQSLIWEKSDGMQINDKKLLVEVNTEVQTLDVSTDP